MKNPKESNFALFWSGRATQIFEVRDLVYKKLSLEGLVSPGTYQVEVSVNLRKYSKSLEERPPFSIEFSDEVFLKVMNDAERYRWLRKNLLTMERGPFARIKWNWARMLVGPECDSAIDGLIAAEKKSKGGRHASS